MIEKLNAANLRKVIVASTLWIGASVLPVTSFATTYSIPPDGNIIGNVRYSKVQYGDTLATFARRHDMGGYEMKEANPRVSFSNPPPGKTLLVPSRFVLPDTARKGIVVNLAEMRLYYYHPDGAHVSTYPVGIGQEGWNTSLGSTQIVRKRKDPTWSVPKSIYENHLAQGKMLPKVMPAGPKNPLGPYALSLGFGNLVIHGSPYPNGVGVRSTHGCMRMYNEDVQHLYSLVSVGTPVVIIHQANKVGRLNNQLYLESHVPLSSPMYAESHTLADRIHKAVDKKNYQVEWSQVQRHRAQASGYPKPIGSSRMASGYR